MNSQLSCLGNNSANRNWNFRFVFNSLILTLLATIVGCGSSDTVQVTGKVAIDGNPIQKGYINFIPADGNGQAAAGSIVNGEYTAEVSPGLKTVRITASGPDPSRMEPDIEGNLAPVMISLIPDKYNSKSELTLDVTGSMTADYVDLVSDE